MGGKECIMVVSELSRPNAGTQPEISSLQMRLLERFDKLVGTTIDIESRLNESGEQTVIYPLEVPSLNGGLKIIKNYYINHGDVDALKRFAFGMYLELKSMGISGPALELLERKGIAQNTEAEEYYLDVEIPEPTETRFEMTKRQFKEHAGRYYVSFTPREERKLTALAVEVSDGLRREDEEKKVEHLETVIVDFSSQTIREEEPKTETQKSKKQQEMDVWIADQINSYGINKFQNAGYTTADVLRLVFMKWSAETGRKFDEGTVRTRKPEPSQLKPSNKG